jgi:hypothetical protein
MRSSWQTETGNLICRWSGVLQPIQYDQGHVSANAQETLLPLLVLDFCQSQSIRSGLLVPSSSC